MNISGYSILVLAIVCLCGCGQDTRTKEIREQRTSSPFHDQHPLQITSAKRFGPMRQASAPVSDGSSGSTFAVQDLTWTAPKGWHETEARPMRLVTYTCGEKNSVECYVAVLAGTGGGLGPNINRWRRQMELTPLTAGQIAALGTIRILDANATIIQMAGHYHGMGKSSIEDAMLLGALRIDAGRSLFIKMIGPKDEVLKQRSAFEAFVKSFAIKR